MGTPTWTPYDSNFSPLDAAQGYIVKGKLNLSTSYATGGDPVTPAMFGLGVIVDIDVQSEGGGYLITWNGNTTTPKIQAWVTGGALSGVLSEAANGTNLSAIAADLDVFGY